MPLNRIKYIIRIGFLPVLLFLQFNLFADILIDEDFAGGSMPAGWSTTAIQGSATWLIRNTPAFSSTSGGYYAVFDDESLGAATTPNESDLITPSFNCSGRTGVYLNYVHHWFGVEFTHGYVEISSDGGSSWTTIFDYEKVSKGSLSAPQDTTLDISSWAAGQTDVKVRFRYTDGGQTGKYWYLDDIRIYADNDASVTKLLTPSWPDCSNSYSSTQSVSIRIKNEGVSSISNIPVTCEISGGTSATLTGNVPGPVASGASVVYTFSSSFDMSAEAVYVFKIYSALPGDQYLGNDTFETSIQRNVTTFPYYQDFNSNKGGWHDSAYDVMAGQKREWKYGSLPSGYLNGPDGRGSSWRMWTESGNSSGVFWVESPVFDLRNVTKANLSFWIKHSLTNSDLVWVSYSTDGGSTWATLGSNADPNWYNSNGGWRSSYTSPVNVWDSVNYELCSLSGDSCVIFRINGKAYYDQNIYPGYSRAAFDDFRISASRGDDLEVAEIILNDAGDCASYGSNETIAALLLNNTCRPIFNAPVHLQLNGGTVIDETIPGPIPAFGRLIYQFATTVNMSAAGTHNLKVYTSLASEINTANDTAERNRYNLIPISTFPYSEDFNTDNGGWVSRTSIASRHYQYGVLPYLAGSQGEGKSWYASSYNGNNASYIWVESPVFDFSSLSNPQLYFDYKHSLTGSDGTWVEYSTDGGTSWIKLGSGSEPNWYNTSNYWASTYTNPDSAWTAVQHSLCALAGNSCVKLRIYGRAYYDQSVYSDYSRFAFDNVQIKDGPDVGVIALIEPVNLGCLFSASQKVKIAVYNWGCAPVSNVPVTCVVSGAASTTLNGTVAGPIPAGDSVHYTFPGTFDMTPLGTYNFSTWSALTGDVNTGNDTLQKSILVDRLKVISFPYHENFNTSNGGWISNPGFQLWQRAALPASYLNGPDGRGESWRMVNTSGSSQTGYIESPVFDLSNVTNPNLSFWIKHSLTASDYVRVLYSIDGGSTWSTLGSNSDPNWYNQTYNWASSYTSPVTTWDSVNYELCSLSGEACVIFRIEGRAYYDQNAYPNYSRAAIDDFRISAGENEDIEMAEIILNDAGSCTSYSSNESIAVEVLNKSCRDLYNIPLVLSLNGSVFVYDTIPGPLPSFGQIIHTFATGVDMSATGTHTLKIYSSWSNEKDRSNDTVIRNRFNQIPIATFPYLEDFESDNGGWVSRTPVSTRLFLYDTVPAGYLGGSDGNGKSWYAKNFSTGSSYIWVESPVFDLSALSSPQLYFDMKHSLTSSDPVSVEYSTDGGSTWTVLGSSSEPDWYNNSSYWSLTYSNPDTIWTKMHHNLCVVAGQSCVKLRIKAKSYYDQGSYPNYSRIAFDNIEIKDGNDVGVIAYLEPVDQGCLFSTAQQVKVAVYNWTCNAVSNVPLSCEVSGPVTVTLSGTLAGPIPAGDSLHFTFPGTFDMTALGTYQFTSYSSLLGDTYNGNDTLRKDIVVDRPKITSYPYFEDFNSSNGYWIDTGASPPLNNGRNWTYGALPSGYLNGPEGKGNSWYVVANGISSTKIWLESPVFDFSTLSNPNLSFFIKHSLTSSDYFYVEYSIDGGSTWSRLGNTNDASWYNYINDRWSYSYPNPVSTWKKVEHSLCSLAGQACVKLRIYAQAYYDQSSYPQYARMALDDIQIKEGDGVAPTVFISPQPDPCLYSSNEKITVAVYNFSCNAIGNVPVSCNISGALNTTLYDTIRVNIPSNDTVHFTFTSTINMTATGSYNFEVVTNLSNDINRLNDTLRQTITVKQVRISSYPYLADFNSGQDYWIDSGSVPPLNNGRNFVHAVLPSSYLSGPEGHGKSWRTVTDASNSSTYIWVESPVFDFSSVSNPLLSLDIKYSLNTSDYFRITYSIDGGSTWSVLGSQSDSLWYNSSYGWQNKPAASDSQSSWINRRHSLCSLAGQSCVKFRIYGRAYYNQSSYPYGRFAFDNFRISDANIDLRTVSVNGCYGSQYQLDITLKNNELACAAGPAINSFDLYYDLDGVVTGPIAYTGYNIVNGATESVVIPNVYVPSNTSTVKVWCKNPNGIADDVIENDTSYGDVANWANCNDHCSNAISLSIGNNTASQNSHATVTTGEDPAFAGCSPAVTKENTVWYKFTTDASGGVVTVEFKDIVCSPSNNGIQVSINRLLGPACDTANYFEEYCNNPGDTARFQWGPVVLPGNTTYYITVDGFANNDCDFTIALSGSVSSILPISLSAFSAECQGRSTLVKWTTEQEWNNAYFILERSVNAVDFETIAVVKGAGNSSDIRQYSYTDPEEIPGPRYYRLKQYDYNGNFSYSNLSVAECSGAFVQVYPIPSSGSLNIRSDEGLLMDAVDIEIYDLPGRRVLAEKIESNLNRKSYHMDLSGLRPGVYNLIIRSKNTQVNRKIIIQQ